MGFEPRMGPETTTGCEAMVDFETTAGFEMSVSSEAMRGPKQNGTQINTNEEKEVRLVTWNITGARKVTEVCQET